MRSAGGRNERHQVNGHLCRNLLLLLCAVLLGVASLAAAADAQQCPATIVRRIVYRQISNFQSGVVPTGISRLKMSADGSKIVFVADGKKIFTINADGTGFTQVFDYETFRPGCPCFSPWIDISANGSKIIWADGFGEIFIADFNGGNRQRIATDLPKQFPPGTEGPDIRLNPRITADGSAVYFVHVGGGIDIAGTYRVSAGGGTPTQLFSYRQLAQFFGADPNLYNGNVAFRNALDISNTGSRLVFGTYSFRAEGNAVAFDGAFHKLSDFLGPGDGQINISGDGSKVVMSQANRFPSRNPVYSLNATGGNEVEILSDLGSSALDGETFDGSQAITSVSAFPVTLLNTNGSGRLDLIVDACLSFIGADPLGRAGSGPVVSLAANGRRFAFTTDLPVDQIWVADILDPNSSDDAPSISNASFSPPFVLGDGSTTATIGARVTGGQGGVLGTCFDSLKNGTFAFRYVDDQLFDNGTHGDATSGDGNFTNNMVRRDLAPADPTNALALRISAVTNSQRQVTAVDAAPFYVVNQPPSGSASLVTSIDPASGPAGGQVTIHGSNFDAGGNNIVLFGNRQASVLSASATALGIVVPPDLPGGTVQVTVSSRGGCSNAVSFSVGGAPPAGTATPTPTRTATPTRTPAVASRTPTPSATRTATPDTSTPGGCMMYTSTDVPKDIPDLGMATSTITVPAGMAIGDVNVLGLHGTHTFVQDLEFHLISPSGTDVKIIEHGQCGDSDNFNLGLDDSAANSNVCPLNDGMAHQPDAPLSTFNGESRGGTWTLKVFDRDPQDSGTLAGWSLQICAPQTPPPGCVTRFSTDVPKDIPDLGMATSTVVIPSGMPIGDINVVSLQGTHTFVQDLEFHLISPAGTDVMLIRHGQCGDADNFNLGLDDSAPIPNVCPLNDGMVHAPDSPLSTFNGESPGGTWTLKVFDRDPQDSGTLTGWGLQVCAPTTPPPPGCVTRASTDVPKDIPDLGMATSTIDIPAGMPIGDVNVVSMQGTHTFVQDLEFHLISPSGTDVLMIEHGQCGDADNFNLGLDDSAANSNVCPLNDGLLHQPDEPLSTFNGESPGGTWTLQIFDRDPQDSGRLTHWELQVCGPTGTQPTLTPTATPTPEPCSPFGGDQFSGGSSTGGAFSATIMVPPGLLIPPDACTVTAGTCTINGSTMTWSATLAPGQTGGFTVTYVVADDVPAGTRLCSTGTIHSPGFDLPGGSCFTACGRPPGCVDYHANDLPKDLPGFGSPLTSTITIPPGSGTIGHLSVIGLTSETFDDHFYSFHLIGPAPAQTNVSLINQRCDGDKHFFLGLDDNASADLTGSSSCSSGFPHRPEESLSAFNGQSAQGTWSLRVDSSATDLPGQLTNWGLRICAPMTAPTPTPTRTLTRTPTPTATRTLTPTVTPTPGECIAYGQHLPQFYFVNIDSDVPSTAVIATNKYPPELSVVPGSCTTEAGTCTIVDQSTVKLSVTLAPGQRVNYSFDVVLADSTPPNTRLCANFTTQFGGSAPSTQQFCGFTCARPFTPTPTASRTLSPTRTFTPSITPTATVTPTGTRPPTLTPTRTGTFTRTPTAAPTFTFTATPTVTTTATVTHRSKLTFTPTPTVPTPTPTETASFTPTEATSITQTPTSTSTSAATPTGSRPPTTTASPTGSVTSTASPKPTPSSTATVTATRSFGPSATVTTTVTGTVTGTATRRPKLTFTPTQTQQATATPTMTPTGGAGGGCITGTDCQSGNCVDGRCCTTASCPTGEFCNIPNREGTCAAPGSNGALCSTAQQCDSGNCVDGFCCAGASCPAGEFCNTGQCAAPAGNGSPCSDAGQCSSGFCVDGFCCASATCPAGQFCTTGQCEGPGENGAPCSDPTQCRSGFCVDGFCCSTQVCPDGQFCNTGTCGGASGNGTPCSSPEQCMSTFCLDRTCCAASTCPPGQLCNIAGEEGMCTGPAPLGNPCVDPAQCESRVCTDGDCCDVAVCAVGQACDVPGRAGHCNPVTTPTPGSCGSCVGDCNGNCVVTVDELIIMVNIALDDNGTARCVAGDVSGDGHITINEIIVAVVNALTECPSSATPTPTVTSGTDGAVPRRAAGTTVGLSQGLRALPLVLSSITQLAGGSGGSAADGEGGAAAVQACSGGGTRDFACTQTLPTSSPRNYTLSFSGCALNTAGGGTVKLDGMITGQSTQTGPLAICALPPLALSTVSLSNVQVVVTNAAAVTTLTAQFNLTGALTATPDLLSACKVAGLTMTLNGTMNVQTATLSETLMFSGTNIKLDVTQFSQSCVPVVYQMTLNGNASFDVAALGNALSGTFTNFVFRDDTTSGNDLITIDGQLNSACLGSTVTFNTPVGLSLQPGMVCPSAGAVLVAVGGNTDRLNYTTSGGINIDLGNNSSTDEMVASCLDPELYICPGG